MPGQWSDRDGSAHDGIILSGDDQCVEELGSSLRVIDSSLGDNVATVGYSAGEISQSFGQLATVKRLVAPEQPISKRYFVSSILTSVKTA